MGTHPGSGDSKAATFSGGSAPLLVLAFQLAIIRQGADAGLLDLLLSTCPRTVLKHGTVRGHGQILFSVTLCFPMSVISSEAGPVSLKLLHQCSPFNSRSLVSQLPEATLHQGNVIT